jgi:hypothetical protein
LQVETMAKVVMFTALAGQAFSVQAGEVFDTSPAEAASLVANQYAREFDAKADAHLPVVECVVPDVPPPDVAQPAQVVAQPAPVQPATGQGDDGEDADEQAKPKTPKRRR